MKIEQERWALEIGNRLRTARTRLGLSQAELSDRAGVDRKTCYNIEKDKVDGQIGLHTLERLAQALGVSPSWLTFGIEDAKTRAQDLLSQAAAEKRLRLDAAMSMAEWGLFGQVEDEDDWGEELGNVTRARKKKEAEEERRARASFPVWPHGYRPLSIRYPELPPLGREYAPIFAALGPHLPREQRAAAGHWLLTLLLWGQEEKTRQVQKERVGLLRELLLSTVPECDHAVADRLIAGLSNADPRERGMLALKLIVDSGVPVSFKRLIAIRDAIPGSCRVLLAAVDCVAEILENLIEPLDREPLALPPSLPRRPSLLAAGTPLPAPGNLIPGTTG